MVIQFLVFAITVVFGELTKLTASSIPKFLDENELVLLKFFAPWCKHCQALAPEYAALEGLVNMPVVEVDSSAERILNDVFVIKGYPTVAVIEKGMMYQFSGQRSKENILEWVVSKKYQLSETQFKVPPEELAKLSQMAPPVVDIVEAEIKADGDVGSKVEDESEIKSDIREKADGDAGSKIVADKNIEGKQTNKVDEAKQIELPKTQLKKVENPPSRSKSESVSHSVVADSTRKMQAKVDTTGKHIAVPVSSQKKSVAESNVHELTSKTFESVTQAATGGTTGTWLVTFYADWCGHCQQFKPQLEELADKLKQEPTDLLVAKVNADQYRDLARRFNIRSFPIIYLMKKGLMYKYTGSRTAKAIYEWYNNETYLKGDGVPIPPPDTMLTKFARSVKQHFSPVAIKNSIKAYPLMFVGTMTLSILITCYFLLFRKDSSGKKEK